MKRPRSSEAPIEPRPAKTQKEQIEDNRVIVVLTGCHLESVKVGQKHELLNCDDHQSFLRRMGRDTSEARPDITHQVYIQTAKGVLIEVSPQTRIPRTFKRFAGLMVQLLHKLSIRAQDGPSKLFKVIKNDIESHLPVGCPRFCMSYSADKVINVFDFAKDVPDGPVVFAIGGIAKGAIDPDYTEETLCISNYPLSGSVCCGRVCTAFEMKWGIN